MHQIDHRIESFRRRLRERPFQAHWLMPGPHAQTLVCSQRKRRFPRAGRSPAWQEIGIEGGVRLRTLCTLQKESAPALVVLHGMTGSTDSDYMGGFSFKSWQRGWSSLLPNLYNINRKLEPPRILHAGASREAGELLANLVSRWRLSTVFLVGVSMGANVLLKLMGEWGRAAPTWIRAAAAVSPLCDMTISWQRMERPSNWIYQRYFTSRLKQLVRPHLDGLGGLTDPAQVMQIRTIRQFDERFTAPVAGFRDAFHYYREGSSCELLERIRIPTLVLHSRDDPFLPWEPLEREGARRNPFLLVHLTERGGHLGFLEGDKQGDLDRCWFENRILEFFDRWVEPGGN